MDNTPAPTPVTLPMLARQIAQMTQTDAHTVEKFVQQLFAQITDALLSSSSVTVPYLGQFTLHTTADGEVQIQFTPDADHIALPLNAPFSAFSPIEISDSAAAAFANMEEENEETEEIEEIEKIEKIEKTEETEEIENTEKTEKTEKIEEIEDIENRKQETGNRIEGTGHRSPIAILLITVAAFAIGFCAGYLIGNRKLESPSLDSQHMATSDSQQILKQETEKSEQETGSPEATPSQSVGAQETHNTPEILMDTVTPRRFLTTMAREHYGEVNFWVYIYTENRHSLHHPDRIPPGTAVVIPPIEKYVCDTTESARPRAIETAKHLATEIYGKYGLSR